LVGAALCRAHELARGGSLAMATRRRYAAQGPMKRLHVVNICASTRGRLQRDF
jgi:hypothetical protein